MQNKQTSLGGAGTIWSVLGERRRVVEGEVAVDLAGGDVVEPVQANAPAGLQQALSAEHVGG